jgi:hypothetical protein
LRSALPCANPETLAVKLEVDTNPPAGAGLATTVVRRHVTLQLQHHDRASLLADELHALLQRGYAKGCDLYDLLWYLSDPNWPTLSLTLLNNALRQTGWDGEPLSPENWCDIVHQSIAGLQWERVMADVQPFLEQQSQITLLTRENLVRVLENR